MATRGFEAEIISVKDKQAETLSGPSQERFDGIVERLSELTSTSALYPEVYIRLARWPKAAAAVLRLPEKAGPMPERPTFLRAILAKLRTMRPPLCCPVFFGYSCELHNEQLGLERAAYIIKSVSDHSAAQIIESVTKAVSEFRQKLPQHDDITLLCLGKS